MDGIAVAVAGSSIGNRLISKLGVRYFSFLNKLVILLVRVFAFI